MTRRLREHKIKGEKKMQGRQAWDHCRQQATSLCVNVAGFVRQCAAKFRLQVWRVREADDGQVIAELCQALPTAVATVAKRHRVDLHPRVKFDFRLFVFQL